MDLKRLPLQIFVYKKHLNLGAFFYLLLIKPNVGLLAKWQALNDFQHLLRYIFKM